MTLVMYSDLDLCGDVIRKEFSVIVFNQEPRNCDFPFILFRYPDLWLEVIILNTKVTNLIDFATSKTTKLILDN